MTGSGAFHNLTVDHIEFHVADIETELGWLADGYGLNVYAKGEDARARSVGLGGAGIRLVVTQPLVSDHPAAAYVRRHGSGVADIALRVADATAAFHEAVRRGATPVSVPAETDGVVTAKIKGFGDLTHTFVERAPGVDERALPGLVPVSGAYVPTAAPGAGGYGSTAGLLEVDHFAVCLEAGTLAETVEFYEQVLDFELTFTERIVVGEQAIETQAVQSESRKVTLTLIEPDTGQEPGQIDAFLREHRGSGVQHIAFTTGDIVATVDALGKAGVEFLTTPATYYTLLQRRMEVTRHAVGELERLSILVDEDHDGKLFQIFARSVHPRNTLFLEIIERMGAQTFGGGNIKALYEAVELQRSKDKAA